MSRFDARSRPVGPRGAPGLLAAVLAMVLAAGCTTRPPAPDAIVSGVALVRERVVLPPEAVFEATLLDVTHPDAPPVVLGRQRRAPAGQAPFAIWIPYPSARFLPKGRYEVRATVTLEGRLLLATDKRHPVPQDAAFRHVDVQLQRQSPLPVTVQAEVQAEVPLLLTHWRLIEIEGEALPRFSAGDVAPHLVLESDGLRATGSGGCNRFLANYEVQGARLRLDRLVSNITLCLQTGGLEARFFAALSAVQGLRQHGTQLLLRGSEGQTLLRFESAQTPLE